MELLCDLKSIGDAKSVEAGAEYRDITGLDVNERMENWEAGPLVSRSSVGKLTDSVTGLKPGRTYEIRSKVKHPLLTVFGK